MGMMRRLGASMGAVFSCVVLLCSSSLAYAEPGTAGANDTIVPDGMYSAYGPGARSGANSEADELFRELDEYWTPERMRNAYKDAIDVMPKQEMDLIEGDPIDPTGNVPAPSSLYYTPDEESGNDKDVINLPTNFYEPVMGKGGVFQTVGRIFTRFRDDTGKDHTRICSGALINTPSKSLVITAAHCAYSRYVVLDAVDGNGNPIKDKNGKVRQKQHYITSAGRDDGWLRDSVFVVGYDYAGAKAKKLEVYNLEAYGQWMVWQDGQQFDKDGYLLPNVPLDTGDNWEDYYRGTGGYSVAQGLASDYALLMVRDPDSYDKPVDTYGGFGVQAGGYALRDEGYHGNPMEINAEFLLKSSVYGYPSDMTSGDGKTDDNEVLRSSFDNQRYSAALRNVRGDVEATDIPADWPADNFYPALLMKSPWHEASGASGGPWLADGRKVGDYGLLFGHIHGVISQQITFEDKKDKEKYPYGVLETPYFGQRVIRLVEDADNAA